MLNRLKSTILPRRMVVKVLATHTDGTVTVATQSGGSFRVIGNASVDDKVYVQDGRVLGAASSLQEVEIEV